MVMSHQQVVKVPDLEPPVSDMTAIRQATDAVAALSTLGESALIEEPTLDQQVVGQTQAQQISSAEILSESSEGERMLESEAQAARTSQDPEAIQIVGSTGIAETNEVASTFEDFGKLPAELRLKV